MRKLKSLWLRPGIKWRIGWAVEEGSGKKGECILAGVVSRGGKMMIADATNSGTD